ncbi:MAG TPA: ribosome assembly cofactor RimP [Draconibacterium sp.]|nr:ribosome assembly cofactor RimP [Draconibacterium sp.]
MIEKTTVLKLVKEKLKKSMFLVDVSVSKSNVIQVFVDSFEGLTIEKCIEISRHVEHSLDRGEEDFELQVSSPGLTESFKVKEQYIKYKDREVEVLITGDVSLTGIITGVNEEGITLETSKREKVEEHKKKQLIVKKHSLKFDEIKSAKAVISFK